MAGWSQRTLIAATLAAAFASPAITEAAPAWTSTDTLGSDALGPGSVAIAPEGSLTVVWAAQLPQRTAVLGATRPPGGSFGGAETLSQVPVDQASAVAATSRSGKVVAAWRQQAAGGSWRAAAAVREHGDWQPPRAVSTDGVDASNVAVALSDAGEATVTWERGGRIQAIRRSASGGWIAQAEDVSPLAQMASAPRLAVDPQGNAFAI